MDEETDLLSLLAKRKMAAGVETLLDVGESKL